MSPYLNSALFCMKSKRSCNLRACTFHVFMFRRPRRFSRPWEAGSAAGNPGFLISIIFRTTGTQRSHGVVAITASWKSRRGSRWRFLQCSKLGQKKKKNKCSKLLGERSAGQEGNGGEKRVLPACCRVWGQLCGGDGAWAFILAASLSPAITVLLHGPGNYPTVDIKDVDSGGDAVENDGTHLPVPTASSPNMLLVPGTASASPRYVSAQARSPAPGGLTPTMVPAQENVYNHVEQPISGRFGQRAGVMCVWRVSPPCKAGEMAKASPLVCIF